MFHNKGGKLLRTIDRETVVEKYNEISRLETLNERRKFLNKQNEEMKIALWLENIDRKAKDMELSEEKKEILDVIKRKLITVEFAGFAKGKEESEAPPEYIEFMTKASQLLGQDNFRDLFGILGDGGTLKEICFNPLK